MVSKRLKNCAKCRTCRFYDATPFPDYGGKLAKCTNPHKNFIGAGLIGFYTLASSECYERSAEKADKKWLIDIDALLCKIDDELNPLSFNLVKHYDLGYWNGLVAARRIIEGMPIANAVEVVHGEWRRFINGDGEYKYLCNVCEKIVTYEMGGANYCPNCGVKMDGGNEDCNLRPLVSASVKMAQQEERREGK